MSAEGDVKGLIAALTNEDVGVRKAAARALGEIGDRRASQALIAALNDKEVRSAAMAALGNLGDASAAKPLVTFLANRDEKVRRDAEEALVGIGGPAVDPLIAALDDNASRVRRTAATALGRIGDPRAVEPLIRAARNDPHQGVRQAATDAFGRLRDPGAAESLLGALGDSDPAVRGRAAEALGVLGDPRVVEPLIRALDDNFSDVYEPAAEALGKIGDQRAIDPLIKKLFETFGSPVVRLALLHFVPGSQLTEELVDWAAKAAGVETRWGKGSDEGIEELDTTAGDEAIRRLCRLQGAVTSNILHLVRQKSEKIVRLRAFYQVGTFPSHCSFQDQREMAAAELETRGEPPYDPAAYLA